MLWIFFVILSVFYFMSTCQCEIYLCQTCQCEIYLCHSLRVSLLSVSVCRMFSKLPVVEMWSRRRCNSVTMFIKADSDNHVSLSTQRSTKQLKHLRPLISWRAFPQMNCQTGGPAFVYRMKFELQKCWLPPSRTGNTWSAHQTYNRTKCGTGDRKCDPLFPQ